MQSFALIIFSLALLILILYLADLKLEFKFTKNAKKVDTKIDKPDLDKLSNAELKILKLVSEGKSNQTIADELFISVHTVKKHVSNILKKLNLNSRTETRKYKDLVN